MEKDKRTFIYQIPPLIPPKKPGLGCWGFSTELNPDFARKARETKLTKEFNDRMQNNGKNIIKLFFNIENTEDIYSPYNFMENSFLLHYVQVPGDACDLGLSHICQEDFFKNDWERLKEQDLYPNYVTYSPHNVDSKEQAYCLLSLWLHWANGAKIVLKY